MCHAPAAVAPSGSRAATSSTRADTSSAVSFSTCWKKEAGHGPHRTADGHARVGLYPGERQPTGLQAALHGRAWSMKGARSAVSCPSGRCRASCSSVLLPAGGSRGARAGSSSTCTAGEGRPQQGQLAGRCHAQSPEHCMSGRHVEACQARLAALQYRVANFAVEGGLPGMRRARSAGSADCAEGEGLSPGAPGRRAGSCPAARCWTAPARRRAAAAFWGEEEGLQLRRSAGETGQPAAARGEEGRRPSFGGPAAHPPRSPGLRPLQAQARTGAGALRLCHLQKTVHCVHNGC